jgi:hypothetical protein
LHLLGRGRANTYAVAMASEDKEQSHIAPFIRDLYPDAAQELLGEAQFNLVEYLKALLALGEALDANDDADSPESEAHSRFRDVNASDV